jgi:hypothetical protein
MRISSVSVGAGRSVISVDGIHDPVGSAKFFLNSTLSSFQRTRWHVVACVWLVNTKPKHNNKQSSNKQSSNSNSNIHEKDSSFASSTGRHQETHNCTATDILEESIHIQKETLEQYVEEKSIRQNSNWEIRHFHWNRRIGGSKRWGGIKKTPKQIADWAV